MTKNFPYADLTDALKWVTWRTSVFSVFLSFRKAVAKSPLRITRASWKPYWQLGEHSLVNDE